MKEFKAYYNFNRPHQDMGQVTPMKAETVVVATLQER